MDNLQNLTLASTLRSARPTGMYDTVEMQVITSPRRYAIMRSSSPRFEDRASRTASNSPFGIYDVERPMTRAMSPNRYPTFTSTTQRSNPANKGAPDVAYNVQSYKTVFKDVTESAMTYSKMRSSIPRFAKPSHGCGPDKVYDTDVGFANRVLAGNLRYSIMKTSTGRFRDASAHSTPVLLGPGSYDPRVSVFDLRKQPVHSQKAPPFGSHVKRWAGSRGY